MSGNQRKDDTLKYTVKRIDGREIINFDIFLSNEEIENRIQLRRNLELEVGPLVDDLYEHAEFDSTQFIRIARKLGPAGLQIKGYGCPGYSNVQTMSSVIEMSRVDASFATFLLVHSGLAMQSINVAGTEEQKNKWLPMMAKYDIIGAFGLTEPDYGSDATSLETSAKKVGGGWILNGRKRWIGNGTFADLIIIWARNTATKKITGFVVEKHCPGLKTIKIQRKMSLRIVQNADIILDDVFVPDSHHLSNSPDFQKGTQRVLETSRAIVAAAASGVALGAFDKAANYAQTRYQFGKPLSAFQLTQQKIADALGTVQGCILSTMHLGHLMDEGKCSMRNIALTKAWCTKMGRRAVSICREIVGGNGIVLDYGVIKPFLDMESLHTYEGTYDINVLIAGRSITGISALL